MLRILIALTALSLMPAQPAKAADAPALPPPPAYEMTKEKSALKFFAIQNNAPVEGKFTDFSADIVFDSKQLDKSRIRVEIATGSVTSANEDVEKNLKLPDWLSTQAFPKAVFESKKITQMPTSENYFAEGTLTLRDKAVPLTLNFQLKSPAEGIQIAEGYATLLRNDFGVGQGEWAKTDVIKNEVRVEFRVYAKKKI